jgi:hypothetical protein
MGVVSIIVGTLGILASAYVGLGLLAFSFTASRAALFAARGGPAAVPPGAVLAPSTLPAQAPAKYTLPVSPRGLDADQRAMVARTLAEMRFLSAPRLEQLDVLLAKAGQDMFPNGGRPLSVEKIERMVKGHAQSLSANPNVPGPDTFRTEGGRFELYDDRSVFYPFGRGETVRATTLTSGTVGLTAAQVETIVQQAQATSGNVMNPSQQAALRTLLSTPGQQHVSPINVPTAVRTVRVKSDSTVEVYFPNGMASFGPQGQTISSGGPGGGVAFSGFPTPRVNGSAMAVTLFASTVALGLAVYLIVCGSLVLRESRRGRKLHLIYAALKIPIAIAAGVGVWWVTKDFMNAGRDNPGLSAIDTMAGAIAVTHIMLAALGLVYPLALLIALQSRTVKDYYSDGRGY